MQRSRFEDLVNGRVEPETPLERIVVEEGQAFTGSLRDAASDAGSFRAKKDKDGNTYHEPVVKGGKTSTPYVEGRDMHKVMDSPKLRKAFFDELAQHNELYRDGKRLTGDDLVDDWVKREKPSGESSNAKKKAAVEFSRKFHNYPEVWKHEGKTYEIQEANPWNRHHRIAQQESGRAAMDAEFGVGGGDMDAKALRTKGQAEGWRSSTWTLSRRVVSRLRSTEPTSTTSATRTRQRRTASVTRWTSWLPALRVPRSWMVWSRTLGLRASGRACKPCAHRRCRHSRSSETFPISPVALSSPAPAVCLKRLLRWLATRRSSRGSLSATAC